MANTISYLKVDGELFPELSESTISKNKEWSSDTGRSSTGKMQGKIIDIKTKLEVKWNYLTESQIAKISSYIDSKTAWHKVEYYDITKKKKVTMDAYFGDGSYPIYGKDRRGNICVTGMSLSIIER